MYFCAANVCFHKKAFNDKWMRENIQPHQMPVLIKIDAREQELWKHVTQMIATIPAFASLKVETANLPIGDILLSDTSSDEVKDKVIIERKSVADLLASIKDGRYVEQSYRLNGLAHANHNIFYLIEGDVNKSARFKNERMTVYSAMFSLNFYKGFSVMRTFSTEESAMFICNTANKLGKSPEKQAYYCDNVVSPATELNTVAAASETVDSTVNAPASSAAVKEDLDYVSVVKKVKKENITPDNISEIMLSQIPGISSAAAIAIMQKFGSLHNLILEVQRDKTCLKDIAIAANAKGQCRKINKATIDILVKFLLKE